MAHYLSVNLYVSVIMFAKGICTISDIKYSCAGFIDFIVDPSMGVCSELLDKVASLNSSNSTVSNAIAEEPSQGQ